ncbi:hypothetical protein R3P38DRAFT_3206421 [Favolaschia claudopus]|uniref:Uncharacterized protein n=1 Tax=Favolaschia claudopus TaxID=2862362 RepID=A0AAW0AMS7_9AGAR
MSIPTPHELASRLANHLGVDDNSNGPVQWDKAYLLLNESREQDMLTIIENFTARFLPAFVAAYKSNQDAEKLPLFHGLFYIIAPCGYVQRFMRTPNGTDLYVFFARKLLQIKLSPMDHMHTLHVVTIFFHLMLWVTSKTEPISEEMCSQLVDWLGNAIETASQMLENPPLSILQSDLTHMTNICHFSNDILDALTGIKTVKEYFRSSPWYLPGKMCAAISLHGPGHWLPKRRRKQCTQCKIAVYCCRDRARRRTSAGLVKHFLNSQLMRDSIDEFAEYNEERAENKERATQYQSAEAEHANHTRRTSASMTSIAMQARALTIRRVQIMMGSLATAMVDIKGVDL